MFWSLSIGHWFWSNAILDTLSSVRTLSCRLDGKRSLEESLVLVFLKWTKTKLKIQLGNSVSSQRINSCVWFFTISPPSIFNFSSSTIKSLLSAFSWIARQRTNHRWSEPVKRTGEPLKKPESQNSTKSICSSQVLDGETKQTGRSINKQAGWNEKCSSNERRDKERRKRRSREAIERNWKIKKPDRRRAKNESER